MTDQDRDWPTFWRSLTPEQAWECVTSVPKIAGPWQRASEPAFNGITYEWRYGIAGGEWATVVWCAPGVRHAYERGVREAAKACIAVAIECDRDAQRACEADAIYECSGMAAGARTCRRLILALLDKKEGGGDG